MSLAISAFNYLSDSFPKLEDTDKEKPQGAIPLKQGETICVETKEFLASHKVTMETGFSHQSLLQKIKNFFLAGDSLIMNYFTGQSNDSWLMLEETYPHQIVECNLSSDQKGVVLTKNSYAASSPNVELKTSYAGISGLFKGVGLGTTTAKVKAEGLLEGEKAEGKLYFKSSSGSLRAIKVTHEKPVVVDNITITAYSEGLKTTIQRAGNSYKSLFFSGEGFVTKFEGDGYVFIGTGAPTPIHVTSIG